MLKTFNVIAVDPDFDRRMNLKSATLSVPDYSKVNFTNTFDAALKLLQEDTPMVIVMISSALPQSEIIRFVQEGKRTRNGIDSAYILLTRPENQTSTEISWAVMNGIDGFLLEPFSVDALINTSHLARTVYQQRKHSRIEAAVEILVRDALEQLDIVAVELTGGKGPGHAIRTLRELGTAVQQLEPDAHGVWYQTLIRASENAVPAKRARSTEADREARAAERLKARLKSQGQDTSFLDK